MVVFALLWASATQASTWQANVNGTVYNFSTVVTSYDNYSSTLNSQAWWGDGALADTFSAASSNAAGYDANAYFAFDYVAQLFPGYDAVYVANQASPAGSANASASFPFSYVIAQAAAPEIDGKLFPQTLLLIWGTTLLYRNRQRLVNSQVLAA